MSLYIVRAKPHNINREEEFLNGKISIGWLCGKDLTSITRSELEYNLKNRYSGISTINISQVEQFLNIPNGSIILTPSIKSKNLVHILKTTSNCKYDINHDIEEEGNPHFIEVLFIDTLDKTKLPLEIQKSLRGARKTVSNISKYSQIMETFLKKK